MHLNIKTFSIILMFGRGDWYMCLNMITSIGASEVDED